MTAEEREREREREGASLWYSSGTSTSRRKGKRHSDAKWLESRAGVLLKPDSAPSPFCACVCGIADFFYEVDGDTSVVYEGYYAYPRFLSTPARAPAAARQQTKGSAVAGNTVEAMRTGILVGHTWLGLGPMEKYRAEQLASEGPLPWEHANGNAHRAASIQHAHEPKLSPPLPHPSLSRSLLLVVR